MDTVSQYFERDLNTFDVFIIYKFFDFILVNIAKLYMYLSRTNQLLYTRLIKLIYFNRK